MDEYLVFNMTRLGEYLGNDEVDLVKRIHEETLAAKEEAGDLVDTVIIISSQHKYAEAINLLLGKTKLVNMEWTVRTATEEETTG